MGLGIRPSSRPRWRFILVIFGFGTDVIEMAPVV
jgi:hypothetical protein